MRKNLAPEKLGDLLSQRRVAILATHLSDDSALLAPVWHEWRDGWFTIVIDGNDAKMRNVRRDPHVNIVVAEDEPPYRGIEVRGEAKFVETSAEEVLRRLAERYLRSRNADAYVMRMRDWSAGAIVLRIEPGVFRAWDFADEEW